MRSVINQKDSAIDTNERYFWDLNGFLITKGVMSRAEIDEANEIVDRYSDRI